MKRALRFCFVSACVVLATSPALAVTGTIVGPDKKPIVGAQVCQLVAEGTDGLCVATDMHGRFTLPATEIRNVQITADGYLPHLLAKDPKGGQVVMAEAGALWVRLVNAADEPIGSGEVFLIFPSGKRQGPFPVNDQGVRIRTLPLGRYRVLASAQDLVQERSLAVDVAAGKETEAAVRMVAPPTPPKSEGA